MIYPHFPLGLAPLCLSLFSYNYEVTVSKFDRIIYHQLIEYHFAITKFVIEVKTVFKQKI